MSAGNRLPHNQPGQRALRLVAPASNTAPSASLRRLQRDLEAAREEAHSLHELLEQLPAILERKFQLRLGALLAEQRQFQCDNALLHQHLLALHSGGATPAVEPLTLPPSAAAPALQAEAPITQGLGLRRALRHLHL